MIPVMPDEPTGMSYVSTEGHPEAVSLSTAIQRGLAPDGGVYMPSSWPSIRFADLADCKTLSAAAKKLLAPFFAGDPLEQEQPAIIAESLNLPLPLIDFELGRSWILELFHGPTASFKDFSARFLAACMGRMRSSDNRPQTLITTSLNDGGCAVAAAFHGKPAVQMFVLYPRKQFAASDESLLGTFGGNVHALAVEGDFDDCQRIMDLALEDHELGDKLGPRPANSISIGRVLPQMSYYAFATAVIYRKTSTPVDVIVPTGNLDNALACLLVRQLGLPIGDVVLASDSSHSSWHDFPREIFQDRPGLATLAKVMEIGDPSSFDRIAWLFRDRDIRDSCLKVYSVGRASIESTIKACSSQNEIIICPSTACAIDVLRKRRAHGHFRPHLIAALNHPSLYREQLEPLLKRPIELPSARSQLPAGPDLSKVLPNDYDQVRQILLDLAAQAGHHNEPSTAA